MKTKLKTVDGVTYVMTHSGQKKQYGDSFTEYDITSQLPAEEVERICSTKIHPAMPEAQWLSEYKDAPRGKSAELYFRSHYKFRKVRETPSGDSGYFYSVCFPYTD